MSSTLKMYKIFIASPGGLAEERQAFRDTISEYNESDAIHRDVLFRAIGWEATLPGIGRPQELINADVRECDFFVLLLWDRWGSSSGTAEDGKAYSSGTEEEYALAQECLNDRDKPMREISVFFKLVDPRQMNDPGAQLKRVIEFKAALEAEKRLLFQSFDGATPFKRDLTRLLAKWLREHERQELVGKKGRSEPVQAVAAEQLVKPIADGRSAPNYETLERIQEGYAALDSGNFEKAEAIFAFLRSEASGPDERAEATLGLADISERRGQFDDAIGIAQTAIKGLANAGSNGEEMARAYVHLGAIELKIGRSENALQAFQTASDLSTAINEPIVAAFATEWSSNALCFSHRLHAALRGLEKAQEYRAREPDQESLIRMLDAHRALIFVALGNFKAAQRIATDIAAANAAAKGEENYTNLDWLESWTRLQWWETIMSHTRHARTRSKRGWHGDPATGTRPTSSSRKASHRPSSDSQIGRHNLCPIWRIWPYTPCNSAATGSRSSLRAESQSTYAQIFL